MHYLLLLPFFANVIVAIFIFGKNPRNTTHCFFALISLCLGLWSFTLFLRTYFLENIFFYKIVFITPFILPTLFLHFSYIFPRKIKYSPLWRRVYWLTGTVIFLMWPWSVQYVDQFGHRKDGLITKIFVVYMVVFTLNTIKNFWQQHKEANKIEKNQLKFFLSGFLVMFVVSLITNGVMPVYAIRDWYIIGPLSSSFFVICTMYAILMYRFFGINITVHKRVVFGAYFSAISTLCSSVFIYFYTLNYNLGFKFIFGILFFILNYAFLRCGKRWIDSHLFFDHLGSEMTTLDMIMDDYIFPHTQELKDKLHIQCKAKGLQYKEGYILRREHYSYQNIGLSHGIHADSAMVMALYFLQNNLLKFSELSLMRGRYNKALMHHMRNIDADALMIVRQGNVVLGFVFGQLDLGVDHASLNTFASEVAVDFQNILSLKESLFAVENNYTK